MRKSVVAVKRHYTSHARAETITPSFFPFRRFAYGIVYNDSPQGRTGVEAMAPLSQKRMAADIISSESPAVRVIPIVCGFGWLSITACMSLTRMHPHPVLRCDVSQQNRALIKSSIHFVGHPPLYTRAESSSASLLSNKKKGKTSSVVQLITSLPQSRAHQDANA